MKHAASHTKPMNEPPEEGPAHSPNHVRNISIPSPLDPETTKAFPRAGSNAKSGSSNEEGWGTFAPVNAVPAGSAPNGDGARSPESGDGTADPRKRRAGKIAAIVGGSIAGLLLIAYLIGVFFFSGHFFPNTVIGKNDVSMMSASEVEKQISEGLGSYSLHVTGWGLDLTLAASDIGLDTDSSKITDMMLDSLNEWAWPVEVFQERDLRDILVGAYEGTGLNDKVRAAVDEHNATAEPSKDATISFDEATGKMGVEPEVHGTQLDADKVVAAVDEAVTRLDSTLQLTDSMLVEPAITADDPRLVTAAEQANTMIGVDVPLMMAGTEVARVNGQLVASWITLDENFAPTMDDAMLTAWVDGVIAGVNTVGTERTYTRPDGKVFTVSGGVYGWEVDRDALLTLVRDAVNAGSKEAADVPCTQTADAFNGLGKQDWGSRYLDIDLSEQYVRLYDNGQVIWEAPCVSGIPDGEHDTSVGVYFINSKRSPNTLIGYENGEKIYETVVQYWMPFDGDVIGLHDAPWQPDFGGTMYRDGYGSHGCVNLSTDAAASLYNLIQEGDTVVSHW